MLQQGYSLLKVKVLLTGARLPTFQQGSISVGAGLLLLVAIGLLGLLTFYLYTGQAVTPGNIAVLLSLGLIGLVVALLYCHIIYRRALTAMRYGILEAQEGTLKPVAIPRIADVFLRRTLFDYNVLMTNLGSVFTEMEECQNRVIGERNRNKAILHSLPGALFCVDGEQRINLSNSQAEKLAGFSHDDLVGKNLFEVLQLEATSEDFLRNAFQYTQPLSNEEITLNHNNEPRYFALNLSFFQPQNLNEVGTAIILHDITDYKHLQESTYNTEKLIAMGQLAAGVAHELNTPLGNIIGYARLIRKAIPDDKQLQKHAQIVSDEARRCSRIIEDLLNYARRDRCPPENCKLNELIKDVVSTITTCQAKRYNVDVTLDLVAKDPRVLGSVGQLDIVIVNLLMNAIQAVADNVSERQVVIRSRVGSNGYATVMVEDNGFGVLSERRRQIFDPFFTTKEVGKGTGLGLAISHAIVSRIGGNLRYDARVRKRSGTAQEKGACFIMSLPLAPTGDQDDDG